MQTVMLRLACVLFTLVAVPAWAQVGQPWMQHYTPKDYPGEVVTWMIEQDSAGVLYMANNLGVMVYDGMSWQLIKTPARVRSLAIGPDRRVYVGCKGDFGVLEFDAQGRLRYDSYRAGISRNVQVRDIDRTYATPTGIYFVSIDKVFYINTTGSLRDVKTIRFNGDVLGSAMAGKTVFVNVLGVGLQRLEGDRAVATPTGRPKKS